MSDFPVLTRCPNTIQETIAYDPTIRSEYEGGVIKSRPRYTSILKRWQLFYRHLTAEDRTALRTLQTTYLVGSKTFTWTNPEDDVEYTVRLMVPIVFTMEIDNTAKYRTDLDFGEA